MWEVMVKTRYSMKDTNKVKATVTVCLPASDPERPDFLNEQLLSERELLGEQLSPYWCRKGQEGREKTIQIEAWTCNELRKKVERTRREIINVIKEVLQERKGLEIEKPKDQVCIIKFHIPETPEIEIEEKEL